VARRRERLEALSERLRAEHGVAAAVATWDLAEDAGREDACAALAALAPPPSVVVLNAGFGALGRVWRVDPERLSRMVRLNCLGVLDLARAALPGMVGAGRGTVVVVSSAAAYQPVAYSATYAATKAFERQLALGLAEELRGTGVRAIAVCPGPTSTEFGEVAGTKGMAGWVPRDTPEDVVAATWRALAKGRSEVPTGAVARVSKLARKLVPEPFVIRLGAMSHRRGKDT
jgi:short-subunit dehydrogenase